MIDIVGGRQYLAFIDIVDFNGLQNLGLHKVTDTALGHDGNGNGFLNSPDHFGIAHAGHTSGGTDVCRNALQSHNGTGSCLLGNLCLLRCGNIHDDAALQHLGQFLIQFISGFFHIDLPPVFLNTI